MFLSVIYIIYLRLSFIVDASLIEDLQSLFGNNHCIEGSLISLSLDQHEYTVLDTSNAAEGIALVNNVMKQDNGAASKLSELAQYNNIEVLYKLISEEGPPHAKFYTVNLILGNESYEGSGSSLKRAQKMAATLALENTFYEHPPVKIKEDVEKSLTPTVALNNIATKLGIAVSYYLLHGQEEQAIDSYGTADMAYGKSKSYYPKINSTSNTLRVPVEEPQISGPFTVKVKVGGLIFKGLGHTIQAARHDAAFKAIKDMERQALFKDNTCSKKDTVEECKNKKDNLKSPVSRIYETAQKRNLPVEFNIISETGKSHKKVFVTQCKLGDFVSEGQGASKKESKTLAAEKMLQNLPYLPEDYDEKAIISGFSNKKKKKKKKKIMKDNSDNIVSRVSNLVSSVWSSSDSFTSTDNHTPKNLQKRAASPKDKVLEFCNKLNIPVEFTDLNKHGDNFYSLVSLGVHPQHVCLGKAATREKSHEVAAFHGMKFLRKSGVFEKTGLLQDEKNEDFEGYYEFEEETEYKFFDDHEKPE